MKARVSFLAVLVVCGLSTAVHARLVACVGDSITYGAGISDRLNFSYPAQLQGILQQFDPAWEVRNFGVSGATLLRRGDKPYIRETAYAGALACNPDIVIIKLGTNDSKPQNWQYKDDFVTDYGNMIDAFRVLPSRPRVWVCKPVPAFAVNFAIRPEVIRDEILPLIDQISQEKSAPVIDLYTALLNSAEPVSGRHSSECRRGGSYGADNRSVSAGRSSPFGFQPRWSPRSAGFRPARTALAGGGALARCRPAAYRRWACRLSGPRGPRRILDDLPGSDRSLETR